MTRILGTIVAAVLLIVGACSPAFAGTPEPGNEVEASLLGTAYSAPFGLNISIDAKRLKNGLVYGTSSATDNFDGKVAELVSPFGTRDFWCVKVVISHPVNALGVNWFWFIKEIVGDPDLIAFNTYTDDTTCDDFPTVYFPWYAPATTGDFIGEVVPDTCAGDLATCNAQVATLTSQLGQCQADLGTCSANLAQCQTDLGDCTDRCELPLLPPTYDAKLTGGGVYDQLNAKLKVSATRKATGEVAGRAAAAGLWSATVTQLAAPNDGKSYWCVNAVISTAVNPADVGSNVVVFVKDTGKGCDPVSYAIGAGLDCTTAVPTLPFSAISTGDFKGTLRCGDKQCCPN